MHTAANGCKNIVPCFKGFQIIFFTGKQDKILFTNNFHVFFQEIGHPVLGIFEEFDAHLMSPPLFKLLNIDATQSVPKAIDKCSF